VDGCRSRVALREEGRAGQSGLQSTIETLELNATELNTEFVYSYTSMFVCCPSLRKRRWFVLKEDCLYYKESPDSPAFLGVMGIMGCSILDLGALARSAPPAPVETETVCRECKKPFTFMDRKHHCRSVCTLEHIILCLD
jgi:hypothetical protein